MKRRLEAGDLFPSGSSGQEDLYRQYTRSRHESESNDTNDNENDEGVRQPRPRHVAFVLDGFQRVFGASNERSQDSFTLPRSSQAAGLAGLGVGLGSNVGGPSALEQGEATFADHAPDETRPRRRRRILEAMCIIGRVIVCLVGFIPMLFLRDSFGFFKEEKRDSSYSRRGSPRVRERGGSYDYIKKSFIEHVRRSEYRRRKGFPARLLAALVGGLSLVMPMLSCRSTHHSPRA